MRRSACPGFRLKSAKIMAKEYKITEAEAKAAIQDVLAGGGVYWSPGDFDYEGIPGLSREAVEKCSRRKPRTIGEASRIPGVTPAAVAIISAHVARAGGSAPL